MLLFGVVLLGSSCGDSPKNSNTYAPTVVRQPPTDPNVVPPSLPAPNPYSLFFNEIPVGAATYVSLEINDASSWCQNVGGAAGSSPVSVPTYEIDVALYRTDPSQNFLPPDAGTYTVDPNAPDPPQTPPASVRLAKVRVYRDGGPSTLATGGSVSVRSIVYQSATNGSLMGAFTLILPDAVSVPKQGELQATVPCTRLSAAP